MTPKTALFTKLLYVAPESLSKPSYVSFLKETEISFVAVDEAHCISEWGHDFRPDYRNLKSMIQNIKKNSTIVALTATATPKVKDDIIKNLGILLSAAVALISIRLRCQHAISNTTYVYAACSTTILATPVLADYHLTIFLLPLLTFLQEINNKI